MDISSISIGEKNLPKWMVKIREKPSRIDDLGGPALFLETTISFSDLN